MKSYDLNLCEWGPYNKNYLGISNVTEKERGIAFDFNIFPGFYRRSVVAPKDICDNGTKILKSSADLSHYLLRYELMWKDLVYIDADYKTDDNGEVTVSLKAVNNTEENQSITINGVCSLRFPTFMRKKLDICEVCGETPWVDATEYSDIECREKIGFEGYKLGERRVGFFAKGSGIHLHFFDVGNYLSYNFDKVKTDRIFVRYKGETAKLKFEISDKIYDVTLPSSDEINTICFDIDLTEFDSFKVYVEKADCFIDGFILGENDLSFVDYGKFYTPEINWEGKKVILTYKYATYEVSWDYDDYDVRELIGADAGHILTDYIHNHVNPVLEGYGEGHFTDICIRPVFLAPKEEKTVTFKLRRVDKDCSKKVNGEFAKIKVNSDGETYSLSQGIMSATTLTNTVFPIYIKGEYIRHNTPGRNWDTLYTWDSGFIGMGLNTLDSDRALGCLKTYLTDLSDKSQFILRGSVVPTQIFLYQEIWNGSADLKTIEELYPYMLRYYTFFTDIADEKTGLNKTWDFFYNSGGWDDYPPQKYVHENKLTGKVYPVITASLTILFAKVMKNFAKKLNKDYSQFDKDIEKLKAAILKNCWDEETGYFGYLVDNGDSTDILKYDNKVNYNMGFDGIYPYIADICSESQSERILDNIKNGLVTKYGVSVVDTRALYYSHKGYWNGSVWMPHQWVLWKSTLDKGESELSKNIAFTALDLWKKEVELTYNCYEHFMISNGRGAGFHQFSGLSTPVLMWYKAYFAPGTVSSGFMTFVDNVIWNEDYTSFECEIKETLSKSQILVCLNEGSDYEFYCGDEKLKSEKITSGAYLVNAKCGKITTVKK